MSKALTIVAAGPALLALVLLLVVPAYSLGAGGDSGAVMRKASPASSLVLARKPNQREKALRAEICNKRCVGRSAPNCFALCMAGMI